LLHRAFQRKPHLADAAALHRLASASIGRVFQADPRGILTLLAIAMCWALAVVLYRVGPPGSVARRLSLLLVVEGVTLGSSSSIEFLLVSPADAFRLHPRWAQAEFIVHTLGDCAMLALYPPFLATALQTRLTRPFAGRRVQIALGVAAISLFLAIQLAPLAVGGSMLYLSLALLFGFALVASLDAWRAARGAARTRARSFALAFGLRDVCWGFIYALACWELWSGTYAEFYDTVPTRYVVYMLGTLVAVPLIAYGILRTQLFDIDLRIRWTIKQSTVAAAVVAIVYVASEGASRLLSHEFGNAAGLLAAAVVVFFMAPLQRFADRVAGAAMPNTLDTPEYAAYRKLQVYEAALAEARQSGDISRKERALLNRLRDSLGISAVVADTLERDLKTKDDELSV
jgi:hypothetical protein